MAGIRTRNCGLPDESLHDDDGKLIKTFVRAFLLNVCKYFDSISFCCLTILSL